MITFGDISHAYYGYKNISFYICLIFDSYLYTNKHTNVPDLCLTFTHTQWIQAKHIRYPCTWSTTPESNRVIQISQVYTAISLLRSIFQSRLAQTIHNRITYSTDMIIILKMIWDMMRWTRLADSSYHLLHLARITAKTIIYECSAEVRCLRWICAKKGLHPLLLFHHLVVFDHRGKVFPSRKPEALRRTFCVCMF